MVFLMWTMWNTHTPAQVRSAYDQLPIPALARVQIFVAVKEVCVSDNA